MAKENIIQMHILLSLVEKEFLSFGTISKKLEGIWLAEKTRQREKFYTVSLNRKEICKYVR